MNEINQTLVEEARRLIAIMVKEGDRDAGYSSLSVSGFLRTA
jgi:hypothetical protein